MKIHFAGRAGTEFENTTPCGLEITHDSRSESNDLNKVTCKKCLKFTKGKRARKIAKRNEIAPGPAPTAIGEIFLDKYGIQAVTAGEVAEALYELSPSELTDLAGAIIRNRE